MEAGRVHRAVVGADEVWVGVGVPLANWDGRQACQCFRDAGFWGGG